MQTVNVIRGRITGPTSVELDEPVPGDSREVEVLVRVPSTVPSGAGEDVFDFLRQLPPSERTKVEINASLRADAIHGIELTPSVCGGEPCIAQTRIQVWLLEQSRRLGVSEADLLANYPTLRAEDLVKAWAYVQAHRQEIDSQIRDNEAA